MLVLTNTKYAWSYEKHPRHYTKKKCRLGMERKFKIQQQKQPSGGNKSPKPPLPLPLPLPRL